MENDKLMPTAIYLGEKISEYDEKALVEIAKSKKIKILKMETKMTKTTMKLVYKKVNH